MRILHVINQFSGRAGAEVSLRDIVLATHGPEFEHGVAVLRLGVNRFEDLAAVGIRVFEPAAPLRSTPARIRHVRRAVRSFRPDLVHTTLFDANLAGRVAAKAARVPVLTSLVNTPYVPAARADRNLNEFKMRAVRLIDAVLSRHATTAFHAITETVAASAVEHLGIDPSSITVVPRGRSRAKLGTPSRERREAARRGLGLRDDVPVLVNVGRQEAQKGQAYLLEAMTEVRGHHPDAVLLLVGREGDRSPVLRRTVASRGLEDCVMFLGVRQDVPDLLCAADVFVFPSLYEGLGGAVLEAMALQIPIVATDVPALREVLDGGKCALLVPGADSRALARGICTVLDDPKASAGRVDAAARRFDSTYELSISVQGMRRLYKRLV